MLVFASPTHEFKEDAFQKTWKSFKKKNLKIFALSINIKNRRNFVNRINENFK